MKHALLPAAALLLLTLGGTSPAPGYDEAPLPPSQVRTIVNPYGVAPLCAVVVVPASAGIAEENVHRIEVSLPRGDGHELSWTLPYGTAGFRTDFDATGIEGIREGDIVIPVLGLAPDAATPVAITIYDDGSHRAWVYRTSVRTRVATDAGDALRDSYPQIEVPTADKPSMEPGMTLVSFSLGDHGRFVTRPFAIDSRGTMRWLLRLDRLRNWASPVERLQNGNLVFGRGEYVYEYSMLGRRVHAWDIGRYGFTQHHDIYEIKKGPHRGDLLVAVDRIHGKTVEDVVIEIDRNDRLVDTWDLRQVLDVTRCDILKNASDWLHMNAVVYDPRDDSIIISGRNQGVVKIDRSHELRWILAPHQGWGNAGPDGDGADTSAYLLTATDSDGSPYPEAVQLGHENVEGGQEFDWPWGQHAVLLRGNGDLMMFDNGFNRLFQGATSGFSRAVEYALDPLKKTVTQVWEYGADRGADYYSFIISDVDTLPETHHLLVTSGSVRNSANGPHAYVTEITYPGADVVFEARLGFRDAHSDLKAGGWGNMDIVYRAERMTLYPGVKPRVN